MKKVNFKKGTGTFVYGCMIMMMAFIIALACIEQFSRYENALNTQMAVDSIADGTAVFMTQRGKKYDDAIDFAKKMKKIFHDDCGINITDMDIDKNAMDDDNLVNVSLTANFFEISNVNGTREDILSDYDISRFASTSFKQAALIQNYPVTVNNEAKVDIEASSDERQQLIAFALSKVGGRYVWGGTSINECNDPNSTLGVDCSGFTQGCYGYMGYNLLRTAAAQCNQLRHINRNELEPGDLCFYLDTGGDIGHVTMYIGGDQVVHASNSRTGIVVSNFSYRTPYALGRLDSLPIE